MGTLAIVELSVGEMALSEALHQLTDVHTRLERAVATGGRDSASLWVSGADENDVATAFDADETVTAFDRVTAEDGAVLYDVTFRPGSVSMRGLVCEHDGVVQEAYTEGRVWRLHLRFPSRQHLSLTKEAFDRASIEMTVISIHDVEETSQSAIGLTDSQREALKVALDAGYYEVPRKVGLQDLADELGESHQSLSEKLRRAHGTVVGGAVTRTCGSGSAE